MTESLCIAESSNLLMDVARRLVLGESHAMPLHELPNSLSHANRRLVFALLALALPKVP